VTPELKLAPQGWIYSLGMKILCSPSVRLNNRESSSLSRAERRSECSPLGAIVLPRGLHVHQKGPKFTPGASSCFKNWPRPPDMSDFGLFPHLRRTLCFDSDDSSLGNVGDEKTARKKRTEKNARKNARKTHVSCEQCVRGSNALKNSFSYKT
jgi:hypothetical protein